MEFNRQRHGTPRPWYPGSRGRPVTSNDKVILDVLGSRFQISSNDDAMARLVNELWEPFVRADGDGLEITLDRRGDRWFIQTGEVESQSTNPWSVVDHLRHLILDIALAETSPLVVLHAAVVTRDEICLLIAGPSGAGKTTLALALIDRGWNFLSDDAAPWDPRSGTILSFPKPLNIKDAPTWERLRPRWSPPSWPAVPRGGLPVPAAALVPASQEAVRPTHMVFSTFSPQLPAGLENLTVGQALAQCGELVRHLDSLTLKHLGDLSRQSESARLTYEDTDQGIQLLSAWLFPPKA